MGKITHAHCSRKQKDRAKLRHAWKLVRLSGGWFELCSIEIPDAPIRKAQMRDLAEGMTREDAFQMLPGGKHSSHVMGILEATVSSLKPVRSWMG